MTDKFKPAHYPINLMKLGKELGLDPFQYSALKYIARAGKKEGESYEDDLGKAIECLTMALANQESPCTICTGKCEHGEPLVSPWTWNGTNIAPPHPFARCAAPICPHESCPMCSPQPTQSQTIQASEFTGVLTAHPDTNWTISTSEVAGATFKANPPKEPMIY